VSASVTNKQKTLRNESVRRRANDEEKKDDMVGSDAHSVSERVTRFTMELSAFRLWMVLDHQRLSSPLVVGCSQAAKRSRHGWPPNQSEWKLGVTLTAQ